MKRVPPVATVLTLTTVVLEASAAPNEQRKANSK